MRKIIFLSGSMLAAAMMLSGCGSTQGNILGFEKNAPDEFAVVKRAPLALPPDFGLRPPRPGAARPQEVAARESAQDSLLNGGSIDKKKTRREIRANRAERIGSRSAVEVALLNKSGALDTDPSIRQVIDRESIGSIDTDEEGFVDKLLFWRDKKPSTAVSGDYAIVDADKERRRIQENETLGKPVTEGRTPTIRRKEGSIFF
jgi:hypothetical protein